MVKLLGNLRKMKIDVGILRFNGNYILETQAITVFHLGGLYGDTL